MAGEQSAITNGVCGILVSDDSNWDRTKRLYANRVGQLEVGPTFGSITFGRDAAGDLSSIAIVIRRPDGNKTVTMTIARDASGNVTSISEGAVS